MHTTLKERLVQAEVSEPTRAGKLDIFGLRTGNADKVGYLLIEEALQSEETEITEVSESGSVPLLKVTNKRRERVLIPAGTQLYGGKQNRVTNASYMIDAESEFVIPVSCEESGRWGYRTGKFHHSGSSSHSYMRKGLSKSSARHFKERGTPASDQGAVWNEVQRKLGSMHSRSPSNAMRQVFEDHEKPLSDMLTDVRVNPDCCGAVFAFGGRIAGVDLFDHPETLQKELPKLARGYALDAMEEGEAPIQVDCEMVTDWLRLTAEQESTAFKSPALGEDHRIEGHPAVGACLVVDDQPVHMELYPDDGSSGLDAIFKPMVVLGTNWSLIEEAASVLDQLRPHLRGNGASLGVVCGTRLRVPESKDGPASSPGEARVLTHASEAELVRQAERIGRRSSVRAVLTDHRLEDQWFSHWHESGTALISVADWDEICDLPVAAYVANALVLHGLNLFSASFAARDLLHEETRGCLFDLCLDKRDIRHKLLAGSLCSPCMEKLHALEIDTGALLEALATVRGLAGVK